jgi:hypothetical protein
VRIKRIDPLSLGKTIGLLYAFIGLLIGIIFGMFFGMASYFMPGNPVAFLGIFTVMSFLWLME